MTFTLSRGCLHALALATFITTVYGQSAPTNGCWNYRMLNDGNRNVHSTAGNFYCDNNLRSGWYRFSGSAGSDLLNKCPHNLRGSYRNSYCGAYYGGWISGSAPSYYDGPVKRTVYFARYDHCYYDSISIWMQNCGYFYLYYFQQNALRYCNYRYCGSHLGGSSIEVYSPTPSTSILTVSTPVMPTPTAEDPCHSYTYLSERNRNLYYQSYVYLCDNGLNGWFRFGGAAGSKMLNRCPIVHTGSHINCGTYYQGWIYGSEPSWYDGVVQRTVMFAYFGDCYNHRETVNVRNCGGFFVYGFSRPYSVPCNFRYCGMADQVHVTPSAVETSALYALDTISPSASITSQAIEATSIAAASTPKPPLDGCKYYQVLSESNRADYYFKRGFHGCDKHLNGWYRFMGDAGNRMLTKCPARKGSFCAAEFQGWLTGSNPGIHEGEVYRTVCFSRYYDCYCYYQTYIKVKNCGTYYVYKLDGVPSCNLRYCGAEDQMAKVECSNNYMRVILDTKYFNASEFSRITLRDPYCSAYISSSYISLGSVPNGCGASREETQRHIIYRNEVIMTAKQEEGMITRDHDQSIDVSCIYDRDGFGSSVSYDPIRKVSGNESGVGSFTFNFGMFRNSLFNSRFYSYPAKVKLRDYLYFEASASVQDNNLVLLVDQCYTTPDMNRNSHSKYMFINNGCPTDSTVQFLPADGQRQRISMQAFRYLKNGGSIYVHCLFLLCQRASRDFRCRSGCPGNNIGRVKRDVDTASTFASDEDTYSKYYLLEAGPVVEENDQIGDNKNQGGEKQKQTLQSVVIGLVVGVAVLAFIVIGLVIKMRRRGPEAGKVDKAEDIGIDNAPNGKVYIDDNKEADEKESAM